MQAVLRSRGRLRGLVFGCLAEVSADVTKLLTTMAYTGAASAMLAMGAKTHADAVARLKWQAKRSLGCAVWRSSVSMMQDRMMHIEGMGSGAGGRPNDGSGQQRARRARRGEPRTRRAARWRRAEIWVPEPPRFANHD